MRCLAILAITYSLGHCDLSTKLLSCQLCAKVQRPANIIIRSTKHSPYESELTLSGANDSPPLARNRLDISEHHVKRNFYHLDLIYSLRYTCIPVDTFRKSDNPFEHLIKMHLRVCPVSVYHFRNLGRSTFTENLYSRTAYYTLALLDF
jgi:hypothetical protein